MLKRKKIDQIIIWSILILYEYSFSLDISLLRAVSHVHNSVASTVKLYKIITISKHMLANFGIAIALDFCICSHFVCCQLTCLSFEISIESKRTQILLVDFLAISKDPSAYDC